MPVPNMLTAARACLQFSADRLKDVNPDMPNFPKFPQARRLLPATKSLSAFEAVARLESFTRAASELSLSQSAVSKQISALELQLGLQLFESKRSHGVTLTPAGSRYFEAVRRILSELSAATASTIAARDDMRTLRLGVPASFGSRWLIPRIGKFFDSEPDITIEFATRMATRLQPNFGDLDASFEFVAEPDTNHIWRKLMPWTLTPVASQKMVYDFQLEQPADLGRVSILLHSIDTPLWAEWANRITPDGIAPKTIIFETYPMVFQAAVVGLGVALAPAALVEKEIASGELVMPLDLRLQSPLQCYLVYPSDRAGRNSLNRFEDWLFSQDVPA